MPESWLLKLTVTAAPAGTVIVLRSKVKFFAVRLMVTALPLEVGDAVGVELGGGLDKGVAVNVGEGGKLAGFTTNQTPLMPLPLVSPGALSLTKR